MATAWLVGVILLACWGASLAALSEQQKVETDEEPPPLRKPVLGRTSFARGETPANPLLAESLERIEAEAMSLNCRCPRPDCTGEQQTRLSRVRYAGSLRYALVAACDECEFRYTRYFRILSGEGEQMSALTALELGRGAVHESPFRVPSSAIE